MPLRICDVAECRASGERKRGNCMICAGHFCWTHFCSSSHECPREDQDPDRFYDAYDAAKLRWLENLLNRLDVEALEAEASRLRSGIKCKIPALSSTLEHSARYKMVQSQMGGQNCHVDIQFDDGITWIARIRLDDPTLPPEPTQDYIFMSEISTLKFLEKVSIPTPAVYHYQLKSADNRVGAPYVLMQKMAGKPLDWNAANESQRRRITDQLADIFIELEKHPLEKTGSLVAATEIGGFAQEPMFANPSETLGPYSTLGSAYTAILRQQIEAIIQGEISSLPLANYLSYQWQISKLPSLLPTPDLSNGPFYLKHYDDKGDHILIDDKYNISGIIDWEFASAEAKELAFSSPCMMWPVGDYYKGRNSLSKEELFFAEAFKVRGRDDLASLVLGGRQWQRFLFFLGGGVPVNMLEFEGLFGGLWKTFGGDGEFDAHEWIEEAKTERIKNGSMPETLLGEINLDRDNSKTI